MSLHFQMNINKALSESGMDSVDDVLYKFPIDEKWWNHILERLTRKTLILLSSFHCCFAKT
jgi:hypothetical protein